MKIKVAGAGPSGLYFSYLVKKLRPAYEVEIVEQNPADATFGFGVVLADGGLRQLQEVDEVSFARITQALYWVPEQRFCHGGDSVWIDKKRPGGAIERLKLLGLLQGLCAGAGVKITYGKRLEDESALASADLVVAADGANSVLRGLRQAAFGTESHLLDNRFAWYGVGMAFESSCLDFRAIPGGALVGHYYPYAADCSTFVMECDAHTWHATGMDRMSDEERRRFTQGFFADRLEGHELIANKSVWRQFMVVTNRSWHAGNWVLIGDAQRPAHPSIGSGTRLALEDSIALFRSLERHGEDVPALLADFVATRQPVKEGLAAAAEKSFTWYESFRLHMAETDVVGLAHRFLTRTGRITPERLEREFPRFIERYRQQTRSA